MGSKEYVQAFGEVLQDKEGKGVEYAENLLRVIRHRGHQKLLPSIIREFERREGGAGETGVVTLTLLRAEDEERYREEIEGDKKALGFEVVETNIVIDESIIGGYRIETKDALVDRTYKKALLEMYRKMIA